MLSSGVIDDIEPALPADINKLVRPRAWNRRQGLLSTPKQNGHNQCMRKTDFYAVDKTISGAFENRQVIMEGGVGDDRL